MYINTRDVYFYKYGQETEYTTTIWETKYVKKWVSWKAPEMEINGAIT